MKLPIRVNPRIVSYTQLFCFVTPVVATAGKPFKTRLIVLDHKNRKHVLDEHVFRWVGSQQQVDVAIEAGKPEPPLPHFLDQST
jgi:hypothetical protein